MKNSAPSKKFILIAFCFSLALTAAAADVKKFVLDTSIRHQVIANFGANDAWSLQKIGAEWSVANKNKIAELLFSTNTGIGLSFWRFYLGAGENHRTIRDPWRTAETFETAPGQYDWSRLPGERWFLRAAKAHGLTQFGLTLYSPPLRLTRNGLSNLGEDDDSTTNLKPGREAEFAAYMSDVLKHFRETTNADERTDFGFIFPVNEPQWEWQRGQEGNRASNNDLMKIYSALRRQLDAEKIPTKILGPESGSIPDMYSLDRPAREKWKADYGNYLDWICGDPQMASGFGGVISYHSYWSDEIPEKMVPHRQKLGEAIAKYPGWQIWQSEYCIMEHGRDLGMDAALRMARIIHHDLTLVNASSWQWWTAVANEDYKSGLIYTDYKKPGDAETIHESKLLWALGNYSRYIRPGMVRVELSGPQDVNGLMASAYLDVKIGRKVFVFINFASEDENVRLHSSFPADAETKFTTHLTSAVKNLATGESISIAEPFSIPARCVMTLVSEPGGITQKIQAPSAGPAGT